MTTSPDDSTEDQAKPKPADGDDESAAEYVDDSQLPEDLQPTDDNPLAQNEDE